MDTIKLEDKPFLIIGSSGQEKTLTQEVVNNYNSIGINRSPVFADIIFRYDAPKNFKADIGNCNYFCTHVRYKNSPLYQDNKCKFFDTEYKIISSDLSKLGMYKFTVTIALNYIAIVRPQSEVYLVGIDHSRGVYKDTVAREFIERYSKLLKLYQTDFNSEGWKLEYKELIK